jgi:hypothetical protein
MRGEEAAIEAPEGVLVYPQHALRAGALCYVCGQAAQVVMEVEEATTPCPFCLKDFSSCRPAAALSGMTYKTAYVLSGEDTVKEVVA